MAIRFKSDNNNNSGGGGSSNNNKGGGGSGAILMAIIMLVFRYPKYAIPIIIIGLGVLVIMDPGEENYDAPDDIYNMGCDIDEEKYAESQVFAALSPESAKYGVPTSHSLRRFAPTRRSQGQQGSCVGWASAYAARTILEAAATGVKPNKTTFSPSFLYNQIGLRGCQGAYTGEALEHMKHKGLLHFSKFPYDPNSCNKMPTSGQLSEATRYKIRGYNRLTKTGRDYDVDIEGIKQNIAQNAPVIIAVKVPYSFQDMMGKRLWRPTAAEARSVDEHGGHAMCLIGYDDNKQEFEIMNSWGDDWGDNGCVFVSYTDFKKFCREAYGVHPHKKSKTSSATDFAIECGIYNIDSRSNLDLRHVRGNFFETTSPVEKGTELKIEITNSVECFTYVFSKEVDQGRQQGAALTVFPPDEQYSSYMGIVGTRLFPREGVGKFYADDEGNRDFMAIIYSKEELDPEDIRQGIDNAGQGNFYDNVMKTIGSRGFKDLNYSNKSGETIGFKQRANSKQDIAVVVIAMDKN